MSLVILSAAKDLLLACSWSGQPEVFAHVHVERHVTDHPYCTTELSTVVLGEVGDIEGPRHALDKVTNSLLRGGYRSRTITRLIPQDSISCDVS